MVLIFPHLHLNPMSLADAIHLYYISSSQLHQDPREAWVFGCVHISNPTLLDLVLLSVFWE